MTERVLVVEDDPQGLEPLAEVLRLEGYDVTTAADGAAAIGRVATERFEVLVVDLGLRGDVSGLNVIRIARALPEPPAVVSFTGNQCLKPDAEAAGSDAFVLKPDLDGLLKRLSRIVAARTTAPATMRKPARLRPLHKS